jgi:asparagine synthase (glutamine-hydrolysing)
MCGFAAFFERGRVFSPQLLTNVDRDLLHRGPDSGGQYSAPGAAIVFRRLAIIDPVARSDQPMWDQSGRYVMAFNGEIYNYRSLRTKLQQAGAPLRTEGDTECILEGFVRWGPAFFEQLDGMFALVIYDTRSERVWAARDPLGIKPLYVTRRGAGLALASEMRSLRRFMRLSEIDRDALAELLIFRFAAGRLSNLKDIELFPAGTYLEYAPSEGTYKEHRFANVCDTFQPGGEATQEEVERDVEEAVSASIAAHLQSDVGYAIQLSGGVDSSLVLALSTERAGRHLDSYGICLPDPELDESRFRAPVVARYGSRHTEVPFDAIQFADALPRAVAHMEGPTPHFGCVMLMLLCGRIKEKHKVVLTGEGADEFFGGYDRYAQWATLQRHGRLAKLVPEPLWPLLKRYAYLRRFSRFDPAMVASVYFDFMEVRRLFPDLVPNLQARKAVAGRFSDFRDRMMALDQTSYLSSLLMRQDKMAMAESVEARVPFAHYPLAKVLNRLPRDIRIPGGETKPLLKAVARRWLPREVVDRRKVGLTLPLDKWLKDSSALGRYLELLTAPDCRLAGFGDPSSLRRSVDEFRRNEAPRGLPVLAHLVNLELWLRSLDQPLGAGAKPAPVPEVVRPQ